MTWIALSVLCSVMVSVLLKLMPRHGVDVRQAVAGNYLVAFVLCVVLLHPQPSLLALPVAHPAWRVLVALGILLPSIFVIMARAVRQAGLVRTDAAQRLSLLLPLLAAFTLFGEVLTWHKAAGVVIGLGAIVCIVLRQPSRAASTDAQGGGWAWLAIVFVGMGVIDILFKRVAQLTGVPFADVLFATFALAFILALAGVCWLYATGRAHASWRHILGAVLLGIFNFGNILFYIQAHRHLAHDPALVFSSMNIGVIAVATVVGIWLFGERLSRINRVGLGLAVVAVAVLATA